MEPGTTTTTGDGVRVLYADPDAVARRATTTWLESAGHEVVAVADGFDALARVADGRFGVVILHDRSPRLDGYRACALIKRHPAYGRTPVILVVTDSVPYATAEARVVGADRCLSLPLTEKALLEAIAQSLVDMRRLVDAGRGVAAGSEWMQENVRAP